MTTPFRFYPLRFEFVARQPIVFPAGKASNVLRGALGTIFRSLACTCTARHTCAYAKVFEPVSNGPGPSGLADPPRPFVFRARHLDGQTVQPGRPFHFDLNLFTVEPDTLRYFVLTFAALAREGLGPGRGKAELTQVSTVVGHASACPLTERFEPVTLSLGPREIAVSRIRVEFLSPTELKHDGEIANRPEFPILLNRIRDRISTLQALYGERPFDMDYQAFGARATRIALTKCEMRREESSRRSSRTGQVHSLGGFLGTADYEGDLTEFLPWLEAARYTGVGRQAVWGKGEIRILPID
jgi:hypothetical protein